MVVFVMEDWMFKAVEAIWLSFGQPPPPKEKKKGLAQFRIGKDVRLE